jgi:hypothetical protein
MPQYEFTHYVCTMSESVILSLMYSFSIISNLSLCTLDGGQREEVAGKQDVDKEV